MASSIIRPVFDEGDIDDATLIYPPNPTPWRVVSSQNRRQSAVLDAEGRTVFFNVEADLADRIVAAVNKNECGGTEDRP